MYDMYNKQGFHLYFPTIHTQMHTYIYKVILEATYNVSRYLNNYQRGMVSVTNNYLETDHERAAGA